MAIKDKTTLWNYSEPGDTFMKIRLSTYYCHKTLVSFEPETHWWGNGSLRNTGGSCFLFPSDSVSSTVVWTLTASSTLTGQDSAVTDVRFQFFNNFAGTRTQIVIHHILPVDDLALYFNWKYSSLWTGVPQGSTFGPGLLLQQWVIVQSMNPIFTADDSTDYRLVDFQIFSM